MALERGRLSNVVQVAAGATVGIITVADSKKVYVKSIIAHAPGPGIQSSTAQVYFVPNGDTFGNANKIFSVELVAGETVMLEPSYPLVLDTTGDSLRVGTGALPGLGSTDINFIIREKVSL